MAIFPDSTICYPLPSGSKSVCFLKTVIKSSKIVVGDYTYYHDSSDIGNFEKNVRYHYDFSEDFLRIGKYGQIAEGVTFIMGGANHPMDGFTTFPFYIFGHAWKEAYTRCPSVTNKGDTIVGNDVWIGYKATILPGIRIGDGAIIGAHSVVSRDVPPYTIVAGNPSTPVRKRFTDEVIALLLDLKWWDWPADKVTLHIPALIQGDLEELKKLQNEG